jgi:MerR family copper efflux transcriptional regulator
MSSNPIACSLDADELAARRGWASRLADDALIDARPTRDGVTARFRPDALDDLRRLVAAESVCCPFLGFRIEEGRDSVVLEVDAPPEARQVVFELFGLADDATSAR